MRSTLEEINKQILIFNIKNIEKIWIGFRICHNCNKKIEHRANSRCCLIRNIRNSVKKNTLCLKCSLSGERNPFYNKKHTDEVKNKISKSRTGKACGDKNSMSNPEHRKKVSTTLKQKYDSGCLNYLKKIQKNSIIKTIKLGKLNCSTVSNPEKEILDFLNNNNINANGQFRIETYRYDILIKDKNILIEYNGDYWHCNPKKYSKNYFNNKKQMTAKQLWDYDKNKIDLAIKNGYSIITIWESDYKNNKTTILNNLLKL